MRKTCDDRQEALAALNDHDSLMANIGRLILKARQLGFSENILNHQILLHIINLDHLISCYCAREKEIRGKGHFIFNRTLHEDSAKKFLNNCDYAHYATFEFVGISSGRIVSYKLRDDGKIDKTEYTLTEAV